MRSVAAWLPEVKDYDRGFTYQRNPKGLRFGIAGVHVSKNKIEVYQPLFSHLQTAVRTVRPDGVRMFPLWEQLRVTIPRLATVNLGNGANRDLLY